MQREKLKMPMMMYGKYKSYVTTTDPVTGKKVSVYEVGKHGKKKRKFNWVKHSEENGDKGFYPSVNHIYVNTGRRGGGGKKLTEEAEELLKKWQSLAMLWVHDNDWIKTEKEKVVVELWAYFPDDVKRDTNNVFKLLLDSMEDIVYDNDYYALVRVMDFYVLPKGSEVKPFFELNIYKAPEEELPEILKQEVSKHDARPKGRRSRSKVSANG